MRDIRPTKKPTKREAENEFQAQIMLALGTHPSVKIWRQNVGEVPVRDRTGKVLRIFDAGPPNGAADISGFVRPEGWRLEIEVKAAKSKRSDDQEKWARNMVAGGCVYLLAEYDDAFDMQLNVQRVVAELEHLIRSRRVAA